MRVLALTNATDLMVSDIPMKLVNFNAHRTRLNIWAGEHDLWFGEEDVKPGSVGNKVIAKERLEMSLQSEIWVVRARDVSAKCGFSQELNRGSD